MFAERGDYWRELAMTLYSMTGFARADGSDERCTWYWEIRTVNSKGLDVRARLPAGYDAMEPKVRKLCTAHLKRGNCAVNLFIQRETGQVGVQLNEAVFLDVLKAAERAAELSGMQKPSLESLLGLRGVLDVSEGREDDESRADRQAQMLTDLEAALTSLVQARRDEGTRIHTVLSDQIDTIEGLISKLEAAPGRAVETIRDKFQVRLDRLMTDREGVDPHRLHQEIVLLATKADIDEELARLKSHIAAARQLLSSNEPSGRQMDFLAQEFNREANTVCSKANEEAVTQLGMQLKTVIDQFREQVQNIE